MSAPPAAGKVVFSGENPGLGLYKPGTDQLIAAVSYWRCVYSEHGEGHAAIVWMDPAETGPGATIGTTIYTDNPGMARLVANNWTQHFPNYKGRGFDTVEPVYARFYQEQDSRYYHRVTVNTSDQIVEFIWWDVLEQQMRLRSDYQLGPNSWDLATVICPCANARILVQNEAVPGEPRVNRDGPQVGSSAFLAFSETWVAKG
jgi:hypothetical protein